MAPGRPLSYRKSEHFVEIIKAFPDFCSFLMDGFFPELSGMIYKAGMFPTPAVLSYTAKYLELHMLLSLRAFKAGYLSSIKAIEAILSPDKSYYISNNAKTDPHVNPFGDGLGVDSDFDNFIAGLKEGDNIDAVKACQGDSKLIWSRAVVTDVKQTNVYVSFIGENQSNIKEKLLKKAPFVINRYKSRSLDFEWRQSIGEGDLFDLYLNKLGWLLFKVEDKIEQYDNKDSFVFVKARQVLSPAQDDKEDPVGRFPSSVITVNVHDPLLRKPKTYSRQRFTPSQYTNEEVYVHNFDSRS
jgi:hypothetical protein